MKTTSNARRKAKLLAAREAARLLDAREDARAETLVRLGSSVGAYSGRTPHEVDGRATFAPRVMQTRMSAHAGSTRREGRKGTLKLVPTRYDAGAPKHGGARLAAGESIVRGANGDVRAATAERIEHPAAWDPTTPPALRAALGERVPVRVNGVPVYLRTAGCPTTVTRGKDDAPLHDTDPGDDDRTVAARAYWDRVHEEQAQ